MEEGAMALGAGYLFREIELCLLHLHLNANFVLDRPVYPDKENQV